MKALLWIRFRYLLDGWRKVFGQNGTKGKGSAAKVIVLSLLMLYAFGVLLFGIVFFTLQLSVFVEIGLDWLYFSLAFLAGAALSLIGSVYTTQNQLYNARDNELLLAMPLRMEQICMSRLVFLLLGSAGYMLVMTLPALIIYWIRFGMTASLLFGWLILFVCMVLLCQAISGVLGWLLHLLLSKIRSKALGSLLFMTVFLIAYFWVYSRIMSQFDAVLGQLAALGNDLAELFTDLGGFFIWLGQGVMGSLSSLLIIVGITVPVVILGYFFIIATYRSSLLVRKAPALSSGSKHSTKVLSPMMAICLKECRRFFTCTIYLTNMGLGVIMLFLCGIGGVVFKGRIVSALTELPFPAEILLPVMFLLMFSFLHSMTAISTPSVSLEGKSLWIPGSLPLDGWTILAGKLTFHLLATVPLSAIVTLVLGIAYRISPVILICLLLYAVCLPTLSGIIGLLMGVQYPRFDWLNETYPCKQSLAVLLTMLIMMGMCVLSVGLYLLGVYLTAGSALIGAAITSLFLMLLTGLLFWILKTHGSRKMEEILRQ